MPSSIISLDHEKIKEIQRNRFPFLLVDRATSVVPEVSATGFKNLTANEWFFPVHWEGNSTMPGSLQLEALIQLGSLALLIMPSRKGRTLYLRSLISSNFFIPLRPGDRLDMHAVITKKRRATYEFEATGTIASKAAVTCCYTLVDEIEIRQYLPNTVPSCDI